MTEENRIAELRKEHSLSQSQLADKLHIAQATLALYETGKRKPNIDMLKVDIRLPHLDMFLFYVD